MPSSLRVNYDDLQTDIVEKVNEILATVGYVFEDDGQYHDGYCLYTLQPTTITKNQD